VVVEVKLDSSGNVSDAHVVSGPDELRRAALESVLQWHLTKNLAGSTRQVSISFSFAGCRPHPPATPRGGGRPRRRIPRGRRRQRPRSCSTRHSPTTRKRPAKPSIRARCCCISKWIPAGKATNIRVQRSLGLGLDEKAIEAVKQWKFKPGYRDGNPSPCPPLSK